MKTLGRIIIILVAFVIVMGITYTTVSASGSSSTSAPAFESGGEGFAPRPDGERPEFRGEDQGGGGWIFGLMKNMAIVAVVVALIVFPKNLLQQKRRAIPVRSK